MKNRLKSVRLFIEALGLVVTSCWSAVLSIAAVVSLFNKDYVRAEIHATLALVMWLWAKRVSEDSDVS